MSASSAHVLGSCGNLNPGGMTAPGRVPVDDGLGVCDPSRNQGSHYVLARK